jgi:AcrR family transcriptional regulator
MRADARKNYAEILTVAREVVAEAGAGASLRDIARRAGVGLGTLYRHFPTREALLDALLRASLDELTQRAGELERTVAADEALKLWLREAVAFVDHYHGVVAMMAEALEDSQSALHAACEAVRMAGARLLARGQAEGVARADLDGLDLFALIGALGWISDQPSFKPRADHLFHVLVGAILTGTPTRSDRR